MQRRSFIFSVPLAALFAQDSEFPMLTPEELKKLIDGKTKFFFLDVREPKELEELGTVDGYVNIPLSQLEKRVSEIPKDVRIVSACQRGARAKKAAEILARNGYKQISLCAMAQYREKGYPLIYPKAEK
jgi:rhodanese-related sulfurtransferase